MKEDSSLIEQYKKILMTQFSHAPSEQEEIPKDITLILSHFGWQRKEKENPTMYFHLSQKLTQKSNATFWNAISNLAYNHKPQTVFAIHLTLIGNKQDQTQMSIYKVKGELDQQFLKDLLEKIGYIYPLSKIELY